MLKVKIATLLILLVSWGGFAQNFQPVSDPDKIRAALKKASSTATSIQAEFHEEKFLTVLKEPIKSSGVFYYQKNDKMRWEQRNPVSYVILINGDRFRVQEAGKEKNVGQAGRMAVQVRELMMGLVNGDFQDNKAFKQTLSENVLHYQVTLVPLNKRLKSIYSKIDLVFGKNTLRLKELTFYQKDGDRSVMKFTNEKINQSIAEILFEKL
jgi:outer membrane lipoprotein-sorting protein